MFRSLDLFNTYVFIDCQLLYIIIKELMKTIANSSRHERLLKKINNTVLQK